MGPQLSFPCALTPDPSQASPRHLSTSRAVSASASWRTHLDTAQVPILKGWSQGASTEETHEQRGKRGRWILEGAEFQEGEQQE